MSSVYYYTSSSVDFLKTGTIIFQSLILDNYWIFMMGGEFKNGKDICLWMLIVLYHYKNKQIMNDVVLNF